MPRILIAKDNGAHSDLQLVKGQSRSTVENMSRSRTSCGVQRRKFGGRRNGTWTVDMKASLDQMAGKAPRVRDFTSSTEMIEEKVFTHVIFPPLQIGRFLRRHSG